MTTWFEACTSNYGKKVLPVDVEKFTDKTVTLVNGRRHNRQSDWKSYFPTADEAWAFLEQRMERKVEQAKTDLQYYRSELGKLQSERKAAAQ